ncbi:hypothetical protein [Streptomyces sp. STR69]|uniref:hypothetical protein n=1 Tax=Streptomyces sp. STR69 TaxID=1796942 RepID=UPI0029058C5C|nr:hypothetical protein [Streptomyces sp. STR69]
MTYEASETSANSAPAVAARPRWNTSFWIAYILTRPLGATAGDVLTEPTAKGGLDLGTTGSSAGLLAMLITLTGHALLEEHRPERHPARLPAARDTRRARPGHRADGLTTPPVPHPHGTPSDGHRSARPGHAGVRAT